MLSVCLIVVLLLVLFYRNSRESFDQQGLYPIGCHVPRQQPMGVPEKYNYDSSYEIKNKPCSVRHDGFGFYWNNNAYHGESNQEGVPYCDLPSKGYWTPLSGRVSPHTYGIRRETEPDKWMSWHGQPN